MKKRSITVRYNEEGIPYITSKSGCYLSFQISPIGDEIEILVDELYSLNKEGKSFVIRKIENDDLK